MLVLSRKENERIVIDNRIQITVLRIEGNCVRIGIDAPQDVAILRSELVKTRVPAIAANSNEVETQLEFAV